MNLSRLPTLFLAILAVLLAAPVAQLRGAEPAPRKVVLIAGKKSHGPEGNGIHDYPWSVKLLKVMLEHSNVREQLRVEYHLNGWPQDERTLDDADTIMVISDGRDGELYEEAPHFSSKEHLATMRRQMQRGCGFLTFHFSTFAPDQYAPEILEWSGGYFDWETDGKRQWYSAIQTMDTEVQLGTPDHPISRGVQPFSMKEEFYYNLRFHPGDEALKPLLVVPKLPGREPDGRVVAWARERRDGGRGFGTTCGHFYDNWKNDQFRRLILNAICWTAKVEVPRTGVSARYYDRDELTAALQGVTGTSTSKAEPPIRALLFAGNTAHQWHNWQRTTPAIVGALQRDPRIQIDVSQDIEDLARLKLSDYQLIVQNYVNWHDPRPLSETARKAFTEFLRQGGGLILVHFANGAWNFSLPMAGESDWPEYRRIVRRVWNHHGQGDAKSGHDAFGQFRVRRTDVEHPITAGLEPFEVTDELYFRQDGAEPIEPLITAHSKVTNRDEPLAWTYTYGQGRVFQTLLGHSEKTYDQFAPREMLRRAAAWCAHRDLRPLAPEGDPNPQAAANAPNKPAGANATPPAAPKLELVEGKFGKALDAAAGAVLVSGKDEYRRPPLTVECWARLKQKATYNILVAQELKSSATHWELFTMAGNGHLTVYLPGSKPDHVRSTVDVTDDQWHYLAMIYEPQRVRLFVDGKQVADQAIEFQKGETVPGGLAIGQLVDRGIGCHGLIDDVRLSRGVREIGSVPTMPLPVDAQTVGLWRFDGVDAQQQVPDESASKNAAKLGDARGSPAAKPASANQADDHFGIGSVGFRWTEQDSVDNRWNQTQVGPFLASIVPWPGQSPARKGLSIRVGRASEATVCYDTGQLACRGAWRDGFLKFNPARFGLISSPTPDGKPLWNMSDGPGWEGGALRYRGLKLGAHRVVLEYQVGSANVRESPWFDEIAGAGVTLRSFEVGGAEHLARLRVGPVAGATQEPRREGQDVVLVEREHDVLVFALRAPQSVRWLDGPNGRWSCEVAARSQPVVVHLLQAAVPKDRVAPLLAALRQFSPEADFDGWSRPGPPRWTAPIETRGVLSDDTSSPLVVDTLTLPHENPYRALMFVSGHDFFRNGDLAISTVHGDVWRVRGVDAQLQRLEWKRFATGLFQPLGLKIVDDVVYVLGRDQITRLHDIDGNGEADWYENFHNGGETSAGGHDYVACLETDSAGNFYYVHATQGVVRVSRDGSRWESIAGGLRNANGLGVGPGDLITAAPQEGNWTPASCVVQVRAGGYYGYGGPKITPDRPLGYDPPLCWIPRMHDNSSGGQTWVPADSWGPLAGQLLHFSYGKCRMMLVARDPTTGTPQGGTVDFPLDFASGVMRGRFSPHDGQLYVSGLKGWVSSAVQDGCLQRVRATGRPVTMPIALETYANGLVVRFSGPLDANTAQDPDSYHVTRWNYRYSSDYGSADYRVSDGKIEGHDEVDVKSATLLENGRSVFLEMTDLRPAMQMAVEYDLSSSDGAALRNTLFPTIHRVRDERFDEARLVRRARPGQLPMDVEARLQPGLLLETAGAQRRESRVTRLAALAVASNEPPSLRVAPGSFHSKFRGFLHVDLRGEYRFGVTGRGQAELRINGQKVLAATGQLAADTERAVPLHKGYNRFELDYVSLENGDASLRVWWHSRDFAREPVPPTALFHDPVEGPLAADSAWRDGYWLYRESRCARCHEERRPEERPVATRATSDPSDGKIEHQRSSDGPELSGLSARLHTSWIYHWLLDPHAQRPQATMPALFDARRPADRQTAADIAAWLATLPGQDDQRNTSPERPTQSEKPIAEDLSGEVLFEDLGCLGCHRMTAPGTQDATNRLSLLYVGAKYKKDALVEFLRKPERHYPDTRMPRFDLTAHEATLLADFLVAQAADVSTYPVPTASGDATRGREAFVRLRCHACHPVEAALAATPRASPVSVVKITPAAITASRGCLAGPNDERLEARESSAPRWKFSESQRSALRAMLGQPADATASLGELAERRVVQLRCVACHHRDQQVSRLRELMTEESSRGIIPDPLPNLTWAGEKLRSSWLEALLSGTAGPRARPWLKARMPAFPAAAHELAVGLPAQHGLRPADDSPRSVDAQLAEVGRKLTLAAGGLDCRQCHAVGKEQPTGDASTRIALGINFALAGRRLHADYYRRFVLDPPRYDVTTKMPKLAPDGKSTKVASMWNGDASRQFDAIWHYLLQVSAADDAAGATAPSTAPRK